MQNVPAEYKSLAEHALVRSVLHQYMCNRGCSQLGICLGGETYETRNMSLVGMEHVEVCHTPKSRLTPDQVAKQAMHPRGLNKEDSKGS